MKKLNKKGFTLIELLAVIVILGVLMLVAIPAVTRYITQSKEKAFKNDAISIIDAVRNETSIKGKDGCYVNISSVDLEKGDKTKYQGYVQIVSGQSGDNKYKITIRDTKTNYYFSEKKESEINAATTISTSSTTINDKTGNDLCSDVFQ